MTLVLIALAGGALSIFSPCILPILPFVFAHSDQSFARRGLPLLVGLAFTFTAVASLAAVAGEWAAATSQYGRVVALGIMALLALTLLSERLAVVLSRPLVGFGTRLSGVSEGGAGLASAILVGIATGFLWAPCAGPILGLVLSTAALDGVGVGTSLLLLAYGAGAAISLAVALLGSGRLIRALKHRLGLVLWIRRGLGVVVLGAVAAIATGLDTDLLSRIDAVDTTPIEQRLLDALGPRPRHGAAEVASPSLIVPAVFAGTEQAAGLPVPTPVSAEDPLPAQGSLPSLGGATAWLNSGPLSAEALRGRVVLVNIWTYACINCRHVLPHVKAWAAKYRDAGLVVVGVHTPELAFERVTDNVKDAVRRYGIRYPVAVDTNSTIWASFDNTFWPANYFADARGRLRYHHFGEGDYEHQEDVIRQLLTEAGATNLPPR